MTAYIKKPAAKTAIEQLISNTTTWIGQHKYNDKNMAGGQTFSAPSEIEVEAIEIFSEIVSRPGKVLMTLHQFDPQVKNWGPVLGSASVDFEGIDNGRWKPFNFSGLHLNKGSWYGFRLEGTDCLVGIGETAGSAFKAPLNGQEWKFTGAEKEGRSYSYFSLAFKVAVRA